MFFDIVKLTYTVSLHQSQAQLQTAQAAVAAPASEEVRGTAIPTHISVLATKNTTWSLSLVTWWLPMSLQNGLLSVSCCWGTKIAHTMSFPQTLEVKHRPLEDRFPLRRLLSFHNCLTTGHPTTSASWKEQIS